jgi:hypothetical protein
MQQVRWRIFLTGQQLHVHSNGIQAPDHALFGSARLGAMDFTAAQLNFALLLSNTLDRTVPITLQRPNHDDRDDIIHDAMHTRKHLEGERGSSYSCSAQR